MSIRGNEPYQRPAHGPYISQHLDYTRPMVWTEVSGEVVVYYLDESPRRYLTQRGEPASEDVVKRVLGETAKS
jgi:hypothetical protein